MDDLLPSNGPSTQVTGAIEHTSYHFMTSELVHYDYARH